MALSAHRLAERSGAFKMDQHLSESYHVELAHARHNRRTLDAEAARLERVQRSAMTRMQVTARMLWHSTALRSLQLRCCRCALPVALALSVLRIEWVQRTAEYYRVCANVPRTVCILMAAAARTHRFRPLHALQAQQLKVVRAAVHETLAKLSAHEARLLKRLHQETAYGGTHQPTHSLLQIDTRERLKPARKSEPAAAAHVPSAALAEHDRIGDADTCSGRSAAAPMRQRVAVETLRRNCEVEGVPRSGAMDEESGTTDVKAFTAYGVRLGSTSTASSALNADLCDARGPPRVKRRKATKAKCSVVVSRIGTLRVTTPGNALAVAGAISCGPTAGRPRPCGRAREYPIA